jgi:hypothetical protein
MLQPDVMAEEASTDGSYAPDAGRFVGLFFRSLKADASLSRSELVGTSGSSDTGDCPDLG